MKARPRSLFTRDDEAILALLSIHAIESPSILDCCHNTGKMWKGTGIVPVSMDIDPIYGCDIEGDFRAMPVEDRSFDVIAFDPPHLPNAYSTNSRSSGHADVYGVRVGDPDRKADNVSAYFPAFLAEAARVLRPDGIVLAKLSDYVHNHRYQWQHVSFVNDARQAAMTPCDIGVVAHPAAGNLQSSKWRNIRHLRRGHSYWIVVRNSLRCEAALSAGSGGRETTP